MTGKVTWNFAYRKPAPEWRGSHRNRGSPSGVALNDGPYRSLGPSAEAWILDHTWPGNVRELKTALAHAVALSDTSVLERDDFPTPLIADPLANALGNQNASRKATMLAMAEAAVARAGGNMSEAARALGVARSTLYRMLRV